MSVVYGREIDGAATTFGTTGYTYDFTFLLYDRKSDSVWYPLEEGKLTAVGGAHAGESIEFLAQPKRMPLREWREKHPESLVLVRSKNQADESADAEATP
jgi:hypothetical protein